MSRTYCKQSRHLSVVNFGNAPVPKVPRHLHQVNYFQEGMLEFDGPMGQCFSRFPTVSSSRRGKKEERYGIDKNSESK